MFLLVTDSITAIVSGNAMYHHRRRLGAAAAINTTTIKMGIRQFWSSLGSAMETRKDFSGLEVGGGPMRSRRWTLYLHKFTMHG
jgi:hypothetical protein